MEANPKTKMSKNFIKYFKVRILREVEQLFDCSLAKKKIFAEYIAQALDVNDGFLENLVGMEIPRKPRVLRIVEESA